MIDSPAMPDNDRDDALEYHSGGRPGKTEVVPTKPTATQRDLALARPPGELGDARFEAWKRQVDRIDRSWRRCPVT